MMHESDMIARLAHLIGRYRFQDHVKFIYESCWDMGFPNDWQGIYFFHVYLYVIKQKNSDVIPKMSLKE